MKGYKKEEGRGNRRIQGIIDVTRSGKGFLLQPNGDIPIMRDALGGALSGDVVEVALRKGKREMIGAVTRIIERKSKSFVGEIMRSPIGMVLRPDDTRVYFDFLIEGTQGAPEGHKAILDVTDWNPSRAGGAKPKGKIRSVLGKAGEHETEMRAIIAAKGFDSDFPKEVVDEAEKLHEKSWGEGEIANRRDFRNVLTFTIDPDTAKDFDDAISYKKLSADSFEVGIHIADVTYFVRSGGALDREAYKRATSVYMVDRTVPMLPPQLSEDLCSLKPDVDRLTFSAIFTIKNGAVTDRWFGRTIIRSQKRFTYEEADILLASGKEVFGGRSRPLGQALPSSTSLPSALQTLWRLASKLRKDRHAEGAIMFGTDEIKPIVDTKGKVTGFKRTQYTESHQLIEELMLLANREVATVVSNRLGKKNRLFVYRIHDVPNAEKLDELAVFLRAIGYQLERGKKTSAKDINRVIKEAEGSAQERIIRTATIRSMAKAVYTTKNIGHYGLAFENYAHFTSPIRRYPDIMVHRTLANVLAGKKVPEKPEEIEERAIHASAREVSAAEAERASVKLKQVEYFAERIGKERTGTVSSITDWGIYIEDSETGADGMVRLAAMTDDTYEYDPRKYAAVGARTKRAIRLGDTVRFKIERADLEERTLDFKLIS
ncbi:ribonuclease R [Candidatus Kaiserbacteria bacterium]|nr:ribonuclease R [Candidatus Kaiserbacteria bacterium]